ncbi:MAG: type II secretion system protein GspI [Methylomonas sp.]|nr:MAG: type II secretion system protein GspI [Methylobacter sp.]PPD37024.1 MAG: type II secretion system protein GspI [Methylomonas sp.]
MAACKGSSRASGFTLLEVMVALALLAIVMAGAIKITSSNISNLWYLENKTIAASVASNHAVELQLGNQAPEHLDGWDDMAGRRWYWLAQRGSSGFNGIWQYQIDVFLQDDKAPYFSLTRWVAQKP